MRKSLIDSTIKLLIALTFILYYGFNSTRLLGLYLYSYPILLLTFFTITKMIMKRKISTCNFKHLIWYTVFFIYGVISCIWSINVEYSRTVLYRVLMTFLFIFNLSMYIDCKEKFEEVILYNIFGLLFMYFRILIYETGRKYYYGYEIGYYRNSIALSLGYGIIQLFYLYKKKNKKIFLLLIPLFFYTIIRTGSRKGFIFPIVCLFILFLLLSNGKRNKRIKKIISIISLTSVVIFILLNNDDLLIRTTDIFKSLVGEEINDFSIIERKFFRIQAKNLFFEKPIFGNGIFGFAGYMKQIGYSHIAYCHNNWLEILSTLGIVGFIIYYSQYLCILLNALNNRKSIDSIIPTVSIILIFVFEFGMVTYYDTDIQFFLFCLFFMNRINNEKKIGDINEKNI